jgi:hypothetical protein
MTIMWVKGLGHLKYPVTKETEAVIFGLVLLCLNQLRYCMLQLDTYGISVTIKEYVYVDVRIIHKTSIINHRQ